MKKNTLRFIVILSILVPALAFAAPLDGVRGFLTIFGSFINQFIRIIFGLAVLYFFWGTAQFILHAGDTKARDEGKQKMVWGIIALFVMVSIFGILTFIGSTLGIQTNTMSGSSITPPGAGSLNSTCGDSAC